MIARVKGLELVIPEEARFSFFNSPYPAHKACSAVDVYFDGEALMPVESGRVLEVKRLGGGRMGPVEHLILIDVGGGVVLKVLHVEPKVAEGETVHLWDPLGRLTHSKFFFPWTDPHAHFELRPRHDPYRARGGHKLDVSPSLTSLGVPEGTTEKLEVVEAAERYVWARPLKSETGATGLAVEVSGSLHYAEGGIPHYGYGVALGAHNLGDVLLAGTRIGAGVRVDGSGLFFEPTVSFNADGVELVGVGAYLNTSLLKLVPRQPGGLVEGDVVDLRVARQTVR